MRLSVSIQGPRGARAVLLAADMGPLCLTPPVELGYSVCCALLEAFRFLPDPVFPKTLTRAGQTLPAVCADTQVASALGSLGSWLWS